MKKVFISQPMNGKTDREILDERNHATERVNRMIDGGAEIIDSFFQKAPDDAPAEQEARGLWAKV